VSCNTGDMIIEFIYNKRFVATCSCGTKICRHQDANLKRNVLCWPYFAMFQRYRKFPSENSHHNYFEYSLGMFS